MYPEPPPQFRTPREVINTNSPQHDPDRIALGIRHPWAELILRGKKTIEVRSRPTNLRGTIYVYSSKVLATEDFAYEAIRTHSVDVENCMRGMLLGTVDIVDCRPGKKDDAEHACVPWSRINGKYAWILENPVRFGEPVNVRFLPYGVWFYPFKRRSHSKAELPGNTEK